jgi:hypothetical protein
MRLSPPQAGAWMSPPAGAWLRPAGAWFAPLGGRSNGSAAGQGWAAPTNPSANTGSNVTTVPVWAAWMMVSAP